MKGGRLLFVPLDEEELMPPGPPPPVELGRELKTIDDARRWLTHPSNWVDTDFFVFVWDGLTPRICRKHGQRLLREPWDTGLLEVAITQQARRRLGGRDEEKEPIEDGPRP